MSPRISIVIPFYQERRGILPRADSPPHDTEYVAFLGSDDEWTPDHLRHALQALSRGFDFYFSDFYHLGQVVSAFRRAGRIDPARHRRLRIDAPLYEYVGDMFTQILTGNVIGTSTVVYRYGACRDVRFEEDYFHAAEDYLFRLAVGARTSKFVFCAATECSYVEGVNVYSGSGWRTTASLQRTYWEVKDLRTVACRYWLTGMLAAHNRRQIGRLRKYFVSDVLHRVLHGRSVDWHVLRRQLGQDVWTVILFFPLILAIAFSSLKEGSVGIGDAVTRWPL